MTYLYIIPPMTDTRNIYLVIYDGFEILDMAGPASVFSTANAVLKKEVYTIKLISSKGGEIACGSGLIVHSQSLESVSLTPRDTILIMGSEPKKLQEALMENYLLNWLTTHAPFTGRYGSVCLGAFILAQAGLLDGHHVTTHWAAEKNLGKLYENVQVDPGALYVQSGKVWTSAGVTTGIDMALAMIVEDHGSNTMNDIAKRLVVYSHRPGNQSQFSKLLETQNLGDSQFSNLISWINSNLDRPIKVSDLAAQVMMTERSFFRKFKKIVGISPSRYVETVRLQRSKELIDSGISIQQTSAAVGYNNEQSFRTAFERFFGITPAMHAKMTSQKTVF